MEPFAVCLQIDPESYEWGLYFYEVIFTEIIASVTLFACCFYMKNVVKTICFL